MDLTIDSEPGADQVTLLSPATAVQPSRRVAISQELGKILNGKVIHGLDAVRALAITMVLVDHYELFDHIVHRRILSGSMGVMVFFVLSGFLITSILLKEHAKTGTISLREFYRRRAFRIFPNFYACWLLVSFIDWRLHNFLWKPSLFSFFYMTDYLRALCPGPAMQFSSIWQGWSLGIEEKFYLLWPLLLLTLLRKRPRAASVLCWIIVGQWIYRAIMVYGFHVSDLYVYNAFDMRIDALLVGCLLAILLRSETARSRFSIALRSPWLAAIPSLALAAILIFPVNNSYFSLALWTVQPVIIGLLLLQFIYWGEKSWSFCRTRPVRFVAQISYSLYLYHLAGGKIAYYFFRLHHIGWIGAAFTAVLAPAAYYCIERPFMRMRDKRPHGTKGHAPLAPVAQ